MGIRCPCCGAICRCSSDGQSIPRCAGPSPASGTNSAPGETLMMAVTGGSADIGGASMTLSDNDRETVLAFADSNMNVLRTGKRLYLTQNAVGYRLNKIKQKTGLDPRNFYDLVELVKMASDK